MTEQEKGFYWVTTVDKDSEHGFKVELIYVIDTNANRVTGYTKDEKDVFNLVIREEVVTVQAANKTEEYYGMRAFLYSQNPLLEKIGIKHFAEVAKIDKVRRIVTVSVITAFVLGAAVASYFIFF